MAVPKKRRSSSKQGKHRSHLALKAPKLTSDAQGNPLPRRLVRAAKLGLVKLTRR